MTDEEIDINQAVIYARGIIYASGWNDAIQAAIKIIERSNCGECDYAKIYIREISKLDKSIKAIDD